MQSKQSSLAYKVEKIKSAFNRMHKFPRTLIKLGTYIFLAIFIIGAVLVILNNTLLPYNSYFDMVSKELVRTSFIIAAEFVIGSIVMDYVSKR